MPVLKDSLNLLLIAAVGCLPLLEAAAAEGHAASLADDAGAALAPAQTLGKAEEGIGFPYKAEPEAMQHFQDARFGMFIHWGPVSLTGKELSWARKGGRGKWEPEGNDFIPMQEYDLLYKRFDPQQFDAEAYVRIAQDAGMRYIVITAKHHDGFSMFDTKFSEYSIMHTPYGRDIVKQLADACHRAEMGFGVYYSIRDWYHPDYLTENHANYNTFFMGQVEELMRNYGKIDVMWFDSVGRDRESYPIDALFKLIRTYQPGIVINNRIANVVFDPEPMPAKLSGDFDTPEHTIGQFQIDRPWESCITIVGKQWSFLPDGPLMSLEECIRTLVECAGGGGNLLLNVGPMPDGRIEPRQAERLKEVGDWLEVHGESIYGTRGGPFGPQDWGMFTHKGAETVYVHVLDWSKGPVRVPLAAARIEGVSILGGGHADVKPDGAAGAILEVAKGERKAPYTVIKLTLKP